MTNAISMTGLTKHYQDVQALTDLTLDVPAGTVFGFLGPNGAGKTTALKVLAGLARATGGSATVNGVPVSAAGDAPPRARLPRPGPTLLRLDDRSRDAPLRRSLPRRRRRPRALDRPASRAGRPRRRRRSADRRPTPAACASGSGIAQALVGRPAVILLDEPVSALDPIGRKDVLELMQRAQGRDDGLLLDPHPRRRPAGQRPRRDPRPRAARQGRARPRSSSARSPRTCSGSSSAVRDRDDRGRRSASSPGVAVASPSRRATARRGPTTSRPATVPRPTSSARSRGSPWTPA